MPRIDLEAIEDEWEEDYHLLARRDRDLSVAARRRIEQLDSARVVGVDRGRVRIVLDDEDEAAGAGEAEILDARLAGTMRGDKAAVGDRVRVRLPRHESDEARVVEVLPRDTVLLRTAEDEVGVERVVVANADTVMVVLAADYLEVGARFADRVMVAASVGGLDPALCINKVDLVDDRTEVTEVAQRYLDIGVEVRITSAETGEGLDELRELLAGCWTAFSGHSGVGKSSLYNLLVPEAEREVGELGRYGGRHTTVSSRAMRVPGLQAWLVDTPGVRSFGLGTLTPRELARHFPELAALRCALDDCIHDGEPGCTLTAADLHPARLDSYRRLLAGLREGG